MGPPPVSPMFERSPYPAANGISTTIRQKPPAPLRKIPAGSAGFRLLCHASRIGGVIGKSGTIIKQLQHDTSARIRIEESPPGTDDRVITVIASNSLNRTLALKTQGKEEDNTEEVVEVSAAQEALIRVFERILNVAAEADGGYLAPGGIVSSRLLADTALVGSVIGKGGKVIERIRKETGCKIRVFGSDKLPSCALPRDEMIEIEGDVLAIKKALVAVSRCLQDCCQSDKTRMVGRSLEAVPPETLPDVHINFPPPGSSVQQPMSTSSVNQASGGRPVLLDADVVPPMDFRTPQQEVHFRILCSSDRVGGVIGKGGTIVRALQSETGASISVASPVAEWDERLITITAMESPESRQSPAQNAVVLVFNRSVEAGFEKGLDSASRGSPVSARLLVPSSQVGCLLGKGGSIISDMRKVTGAVIKIIGGSLLPKCASENDQVVQMTGEFVNVRDALYNITGRLRNNLFSIRMLNAPGRGSSSKIDINPYGRGLGPPSLGHSSGAASHNANQHTTLTQSMDNLRLSHGKDRPSSPSLWKSQAAGANPRSGQDAGRGLTSVKGGLELGSGNRSAIVTNSTVEIVVPQNVIGSVLGDNGSNLTRLRQISGAKVVVHEPRPGTSDRIVIISGSPDETQAAQSLLQAFILTGQS